MRSRSGNDLVLAHANGADRVTLKDWFNVDRSNEQIIHRLLDMYLDRYDGNGPKLHEFFERIGAKGHHDHMVCTRCGKIIEFQCAEIEKSQDKVCEQYGFKLSFHDHRLFGFCKECQ